MKNSAVKYLSLLCTLIALLLLPGCGKKERKAYLNVEGQPGRILKIDRENVIKVDKNLRLAISPGNHLLELSTPGFETIYLRTRFRVGKSYTLKPEMRPIFSSVLIESQPVGAQVTFNGSVKGTTPLVIRDIPVGTHKAHLNMPGYAPREISWIIRDARPLPKIKVSLDSNTSQVKITSNPEGAQVFIDNVPVGITPFQGNFEIGLHLVKLTKNGFVELVEQIDLKRSQMLHMKRDLRALPGTIRIVSSPAGAVISIDGKKRGIAPLSMELDAGQYALKVEKDGFDPIERRITIAPAQNEETVIKLGSATGSARFLIYPGNVALKLDGRDMGKVPEKGEGHREINFSNLSPGTHVLEMTHPMAKPSTRRLTFSVQKGKLYQPENPIEIWIANCEVTYPDGRKEKGALYYETPNGILFGPTPKIKFELKKNQIKSFRRLQGN